MYENITPVVFAYNEEANIGRCLDRLQWARRVVVIDSLSDDETINICNKFANAVVIKRKWDSYWDQRNYADTEVVTTDWVLALDADYILTDEFIEELSTLRPDDTISGYTCYFNFLLKGKKLRCSIYPPLTRLYRRDRSNYVQDGHKEVLQLKGAVSRMRSRISHDDRKPLLRWIQSQLYYTPQEAKKILEMNRSKWELKYILRSWIPISPVAVAFYILIIRGGIFDGIGGLYYCLQRVIAESLICLHYLDISWSKQTK